MCSRGIWLIIPPLPPRLGGMSPTVQRKGGRGGEGCVCSGRARPSATSSASVGLQPFSASSHSGLIPSPPPPPRPHTHHPNSLVFPSHFTSHSPPPPLGSLHELLAPRGGKYFLAEDRRNQCSSQCWPENPGGVSLPPPTIRLVQVLQQRAGPDVPSGLRALLHSALELSQLRLRAPVCRGSV